MLSPEEIHTAMLDNVLNLTIPWPSKQNILFTCVQDIHFISSTVNSWKEKELISDDDYAYLNELMTEKQKDVNYWISGSVFSVFDEMLELQKGYLPNFK